MSDYVVKVQEDAFRRGEELAAVLDIECTTAMGILLYIWRWVLTLKPDSAPDGIILGRATCLRLEAAARWRGPRGKLVEAMLELGLITRQTKKMRVKGTKPYADEWRRKEKARKRECARRQEKRAAKQQPPRPTPKLVPAKLSEAASGFWNWLMEERARDVWKPGHDPMGPRQGGIERPGCAPDRAPPAGFGEWFDARMTEKIAVEQLAHAWLRYLGDDTFRTRRWPIAVFMTEGIFRSRLTA